MESGPLSWVDPHGEGLFACSTPARLPALCVLLSPVLWAVGDISSPCEQRCAEMSRERLFRGCVFCAFARRETKGKVGLGGGGTADDARSKICR